uniref:Uncharacterized protein LOC104246309 n=1 Tax=Nicotiana sylvestris TaxID=4096 RepID=A0A1U7YEM9_NICSY|nr:PREDICTED: uncharacterized protein LOC104246309 [Nicotiana sylvestris]
MRVEESVHVLFDETNTLYERQEHEYEAIGLVRNSNKTIVQTEAAIEEGTGDGIGSSTQDNLTGGTEQRRTDPQTLREPIHGPISQQQNTKGTSRGNQLVVKSNKNKTRLVVQGHSQEEGIDYDETFTPVARLEAIRLIIAFSAYMEFTLHQMDVKNAVLNGYLKEQMFVKQPPSFEIKECPNHA